MDYSDLESLIQQCASGVAPSTMAAIIKVESGGNPWSIGDNTAGGRVLPTPRNINEAAAKALELLKQGHSLDLGLAQINSNNLKAYGVSVREVFEPCTNVNVGSKILSKFYFKSVEKYGHGDVSLFHSLSAYNTGSFYKGPNYVLKILRAAGSKASISSVSWKQPVLKSNYKRTDQQLVFTPLNSPIIAFHHIDHSISAENPPNEILSLN